MSDKKPSQKSKPPKTPLRYRIGQWISVKFFGGRL